MAEFEGKVAVITGGGGGIGKAAAAGFLDEGATVVLAEPSPGGAGAPPGANLTRAGSASPW